MPSPSQSRLKSELAGQRSGPCPRPLREYIGLLLAGLRRSVPGAD
jgi:hypothetical protein